MSSTEIVAVTPRAMCLTDFLSVRGTKASQFIADLEDATALLRADEVLVAPGFWENVPSAFGRLAELLRASRKAPHPIRSAIERVALRVVQSASPELINWSSNPSTAPSDELLVLAKWAKPLLKAKGDRNRAEGVLSVAVALITDARRLDAVSIIEAVGAAYGVEAPEGENDQRPTRVAAQLIAKSNPRQLAAFAKITVLNQAALARAQASADGELLRGRVITEQLGKTQAELTALREVEKTLLSRVEGLERKVEELARKTESAERVGAHDLNGLKARYRHFLGGQLLPVANDALGAVEFNPPRPDFARDFIAELIRKIDKEIAWLNAPSE